MDMIDLTFRLIHCVVFWHIDCSIFCAEQFIKKCHLCFIQTLQTLEYSVIHKLHCECVCVMCIYL